MNKIALSPNSLVGVPALDYIDALVKAGYDGIGLRMYASPGVNYESVTQPIAGNPALMRDVKQALADSGLILYDILSYYIRPNFDIDRMLPSLEFGAELGFPYALAIADDPDWNRQRDNFGLLCDTAQALNMTVTLEAPVNQNALNTLPKALQLIDESQKPNAAICLDPFHFWRAGHAAEMLKSADSKLFPYTQIDDGVDTDGPPPRGRREIGAGQVPLFDILDALPAGLPLSIEWGRPQGTNYSPAEWAKIALEATRRFVERYEAERPNDQAAANVRAMTQAQLERLDSDLRVLSPLGIERAAWGWDRHASLEEFHTSERTALHAIETAGEGAEWDTWRQRLFHEVEGQQALVAWHAEHQLHAPHVHKAERAAFAAALGLFAQSRISHAHYARLVRAMAEALPWLLPEQPPEPAR